MRSLQVIGIACALVASSATAHAQDKGIDAHLYRPSFDPAGGWSLESGRALAPRAFTFDVSLGVAREPLRVAVPGVGGDDLETSPDSVLSHATALHMTAAFGLMKRLTLGIDVGMVRTDPDVGYGDRGLYRSNGADPSTGLISLRQVSNIDPSSDDAPAGRVVPLDARVALKLGLLDGPIRLAALAIVSVPFGDEEMFLGDAGIVLEPQLAADASLGERVRLFINAGARFRHRTQLEAFDPMTQTADDAQIVLDVGSELVAGSGVVVDVADRVSVAVEGMLFSPLPAAMSLGTCRRFSGERCSAADDMDYFAGRRYGDPAAYALGGVRFAASPEVSLHASGAVEGLVGDGRGALFRVMAGVTWYPRAASQTRLVGHDMDGDGLPDAIDMCPDEREDEDGYQDDDGCAELDNDGDGVIDVDDKCPNDPEDRDGYQDDDGCAETDNDGDGIADVLDRCPFDPEDLDQYDDTDGCPDEDNDGDGIADARDKCPNEQETVNGVADTDGCPDESIAGGPVLLDDRIDLRGEIIAFRGRADLTVQTRAVLDEVAQVMAENAGLRIRVEVHVARSDKSTRGRALRRALSRDERLAAARAAAVVEYLQRQGVERNRLDAAGLGSNVTLDGRQPWDPRNERVDFTRTEQR